MKLQSASLLVQQKIKPLGWVIVAFTLVQVAIILFLANGPHNDEAIHILSGMGLWQETSWMSFIKFLPLFAIGFLAGGLEGARIAALAIALIGLIGFAKIAERLFGDRAAFWATLALCLHGLFNAFVHFADGGVTVWLGIVLMFWIVLKADRRIQLISSSIVLIVSILSFISRGNIYDTLLFCIYAAGAPLILAFIGSVMVWREREQSVLVSTWLFSLALLFAMPESWVVFGAAFLYPFIGVVLDRIWNSRTRFAIPLILAVLFVWGKVQWDAQEHSWNDVRPAAQYLLQNFQKGDRLAASDASSFLLYLYPRGLAKAQDVFDENTAARMQLDLCQVQWLVSVNKGIRNPVLDDEVQYALKHCGHDTKFTYADSVVHVQETTPFAGWQSVISVAHLDAPRPTETLVWRMGQPLPQGRFELKGAVVNNKVYVMGGFYLSPTGQILATQRMDVYDPDTNQWNHLADLPEPITHAGVVVDGTNIYLVGGFVGDSPGVVVDHVWKYNTVTNQWTPFVPLPKKRGAGAAVLLNRSIHFFGGEYYSDGAQDPEDFGDHWVLDLENGSKWLPVAPLPNPRNHLTGIVFRDKIFAIGGQRLNDEMLGIQTVVHVYDPRTDQWSVGTNLPFPVSRTSSATFVKCDRIVMIGGETINATSLDTILEFDPLTNKWSVLNTLPAPRVLPVALAIGDKIVATGGLLGTEKRQTWLTDWKCP